MTPTATCQHEHSHVKGRNWDFDFEALAETRPNVDPTRTKTLRADYMADVYKRFRETKGDIRTAVVDLDVFGLGNKTIMAEMPDLNDFRFATVSDKKQAFDNWLEYAMNENILEPQPGVARQWQGQYVRRSYASGLKMSTKELRAAGLDVPMFSDQTLQQFLNAPIHRDSLELLYTRNFSALKGITNEVDKEISRTLTEGLSQGFNPRKMARELNGRVDAVGITRARTMARTETIYAHNEAALNRYQQAGVKEVAAEVEWVTAGDNRVCPDCVSMGDRIFTLKEARGLIPFHPNCRCTWVPATFPKTQMSVYGNLRFVEPNTEVYHG